MADNATYDYIILGAGCAGWSLLHRMAESPILSDKRILILEAAAKNENDRTWCYWEREEGYYDHLVEARWPVLQFYNSDLALELDIAPYTYKKIRGIDFYRYHMEKLGDWPNVDLRQERVVAIDERDGEVCVRTSSGEYRAAYVFKSYPSSSVAEGELSVIQHFGGWEIKTAEAAFDQDSAVFMDFRMPQEGEVRFFYVLPVSERRALVELAVFSDEVWDRQRYDEAIDAYIRERVGVVDFEIKDREYGAIPMTEHRFWEDDTDRIIHIGTGAGAVKPSSGYAIARIQRHSDYLLGLLESGQWAARAAYFDHRHLRLDRTLLHVLLRQRADAGELFGQLFERNSADRVLAFLNEETTVVEELPIFWSLPTWPFLKGFLASYT